MRALLLLLLCACSAWSATSSTIAYRSYASSYPLLVAIPSTYSSPSLVVTLHGAGEVGNGSSDGTLTLSAGNQVANTLTHGALETVKNGVTWFADHNVIVAAPQCTSQWSSGTLQTTIAALIAEFGVRPDRVCVCGLSIGGYGVWNWAKANPTVPYSIMPCAGANGGDPTPTSITTLGGVKIYYIHDADDGTAAPAWDYGTAYASQPFTNGWWYELTGAGPLDTHPEAVWSTHAVAPHLSGVTTTRSSTWNGTAWTWTSGATLPTGTWGTTLYATGGHGGWDLMYGTGTSDFPTATWAWALGVSTASGPFPAPLRSGSQKIAASMLLAANGYATLGRPAALTAALAPTHEFTILVRTARAAPTTAGTIIGMGGSGGTQVAILSQGGSRASGTIGNVTFTTGAGSIQQPTWNTIAIVNRNAAGTMMGRIVLDGAAGTTETASGTTTSANDLIIGGQRNTSNADITSLYSGNIGDVVIWNYALTDDQIHYAMGYIQPDEVLNGLYASGIVGYYPCNETSGTVLHDGALGNDGTCSTTGLFSTAAYPKYPVVTIGDSLTSGSGSETNTPYGDQLKTGGGGIRNMRSHLMYGFAGQNCAFIATQTALSTFTPFRNWTAVYLVGIHDLGANSTVTTFLANEIASLPHKRYLIIGNRPYGVTGVVTGVGTPTAAGIGDWGTTARGQIDSMNYLLQSIYGGRFLSEQFAAVGQATLPAEANDVFQLRTPTHICNDNTHLMDAGYILQSTIADAALTANGW